jgi:hypothetical protein
MNTEPFRSRVHVENEGTVIIKYKINKYKNSAHIFSLIALADFSLNTLVKVMTT